MGWTIIYVCGSSLKGNILPPGQEVCEPAIYMAWKKNQEGKSYTSCV